MNQLPRCNSSSRKQASGLYVYMFNFGLLPSEKKIFQIVLQRYDHCKKSAKVKTSFPGTLLKLYTALKG